MNHSQSAMHEEVDVNKPVRAMFNSTKHCQSKGESKKLGGSYHRGILALHKPLIIFSSIPDMYNPFMLLINQ